jgi:hypothetical protein
MKALFNRIKRRFALRAMAKFFSKIERNPVTRTPKELNLEFENVSFKSLDGLNLKGWYIPSSGSNKLVVFNHFMLGNKAGAVPHKDWGNVAVDFMPIYKHLVDAGYNVFTYDLRNHGESDMYEDGKLGLTHVEYQDSVASMRYVKSRFPDAELYLYSQCYGTVSTMRAIEKHPEDFEDVKAYINLQPLSADAFVTGVTRQFKMEHEESIGYFSDKLKARTGYEVNQLKVPDLASKVKIPTLLVQVHNDWRTTNEDIEKVYDNLGAEDKKLLWIKDREERLEGYNYFGRKPEEMLNWFENH